MQHIPLYFPVTDWDWKICLLFCCSQCSSQSESLEFFLINSTLPAPPLANLSCLFKRLLCGKWPNVDILRLFGFLFPIEKKIEAMTAQGIMQGIIITLVPFILLIVFLLVDPNYVAPLFNSVAGWISLSFMLFLQILGGVMIKKVVTIKV